MPPVNKNINEIWQPKQDRRAIHLDREMITSNPTSNAGLRTTGDPYSSNSSHKIAVSREPHIVSGRIIDVIAYAKYYKVQLARGGPIIPCCQLTHASSEVVGAREFNNYVPGTQVAVMWEPHMLYGVIIGAMPDWMISADQALSDVVVQGSNVGLNVDPLHSYPFNLGEGDGGGIIDWSSGRPFDDIPIGSWGAVTDTGLMMFLDPSMTFLRVDEETGLFLFYDNQRCRVTGHNLQLRSAGHERDDQDDQDEFTVEEGYNAYLWERRGAFDTLTDVYREVTPDDQQTNTPWYSLYEPAEDDQQAIFRLRIFRGYLGQGDMKSLSILPQGSSGLQQYPDETQFPGVAQESISTDGLLTIRSAKAVIIAKRALIPQPKRLLFDEDPNGDNNTNYKADGMFGSGPNHLVADITNAATSESEVRSAAFLDLYAHAFNWRNLLAFYYHTKDWYIPDESDYPYAPFMANGNPTFAELSSSQYLSIPLPISMKVDDRYGDVDYYPADSYLALLEDGGLILADGYGFELRTSRGNAYMTMPGDMYIVTGRNCEMWGGFDVGIRANNSIDVAANKGDLRLKADQQAYLFGGNETCGGVLIESRSPHIAFSVEGDGDTADEIVGGIVLRAKHSAIVSYARQFNVTLSCDGDEGVITLDAGADGDIVTKSNHYFRHIQQSAQDVFWKDDTTVYAVNEYWCDSTLLDNKLRVNDDTYISGCLLVFNDITAGGHVTAQSFDLINDCSTLLQAENDLQTRVSQLQSWAISAKPDVTQLIDETDVLNLEVFFRSSALQQTPDDFKFFETKWMQASRLIPSAVSTWTENPLTSEDAWPGEISYPPPGKAAWSDDENYWIEDLNLFDLSNNQMQDRGPLYETAAYEEPSNMALDGNLPVIRDP